jgi:hypothetical protein
MDFCEGREVIVLGDFNLPSLVWSTGMGLCVGGSRNDQLFLNCFVEAGLYQWVEEATNANSGNVLDLFLTSETDRVGAVEVLAPFPRCIHSPVVCHYLFYEHLNVDGGQPETVHYLWHRGNYHGLSSALSVIDWNLEFAHLMVCDAYEVFLNVVHGLVALYVPVSDGEIRVPWCVNPPRILKGDRSRAWHTYKVLRARHGRFDDRAAGALVEFNNLNFQLRHYVRNSRSQYENSLIERYKDAPKLFHAYIRKKKKGRIGVGPLRLPCGQLVDTPAEMAELLVSTFASVFVGDVPMNPAPHQSFEGFMEDSIIEAWEVYEVLVALDVNSAMGPDNVHPKVLKSCAEQLALPLAILFNRSLESGVLPSRWLESVVIPLFKGKSRYDPGNYRPVSLTSVCCKSMERIVVARLVDYLESNDLLSPLQFGFRKARSTEDQMLLVYSEVAEMVDEGMVVDMALLDFSKAFDVVSHTILLEKLRFLGVSEVLVGWVRGFLSGRVMSVSVDGICSGARDVLSGVPQGSVLGPILFLVYVNHLTHRLGSRFGAFADDFKIYLHYQRQDVLEVDGMATLQRDLDAIFEVAASWNLFLNPAKCVVMRFSRHFAGINTLGGGTKYRLGNSVLEFVDSHRDLGVVVDTRLRFHCHVRDMVCRAAGLCSSLLRSTVNRSPEFMVTLFVTHVRPILDYCSCVWNVGFVEDMHLMESVQRRWTKQVYGLSNVDYNARLRALDLFSIRGRLLRAGLIKYWKVLCCDTEGYDLNVLFQRAMDVRTRGHQYKLVMPLCATDVRKRFFNVRHVKIWNSLPCAVVESTSVSRFKASLADFLGDVLFEF